MDKRQELLNKLDILVREIDKAKKIVDDELCETGTCGCSNCIVFHRNVAEKGRDGDR